MSHILIDGLTKHFDGKPPTTAIDDLHLEIAEGEFLVLLGPSGCGKTTTLRSLAGLETPDEGRISLGEQTVLDGRSKINQPPNKRRIGMVFQSYALWPHMTVRRNIGYPLRARRVERTRARQWTEETAQLVDCAALLDRYPGQLSGGQQQRVAIARALANRPALLFADEPTGELDLSTGRQILELFRRLNQDGMTIVVVTHDEHLAADAGRVIHLLDGRLTSSSPNSPAP